MALSEKDLLLFRQIQQAGQNYKNIYSENQVYLGEEEALKMAEIENIMNKIATILANQHSEFAAINKTTEIPFTLDALYDKLKVLLVWKNAVKINEFDKKTNYDIALEILAISEFDCAEYSRLFAENKKEAKKDVSRSYLELNKCIEIFTETNKQCQILKERYEVSEPFLKQYSNIVGGKSNISKTIDLLHKQALSDDGIWLPSPEDIIDFKDCIASINEAIELYNKFNFNNNETVPRKYVSAAETLKRHLAITNIALTRTVENLENPDLQPLPKKGHEHLALQKLTGSLFEKPNPTSSENDIDVSDVQQGLVADCYLLAVLLGLAKKYPLIIRNAIVDKGKGVYEVTFYIREAKNSSIRKAQKVCVNNEFIVNSSGKSAYARQGDQNELWILVIEKAMAKLLGGYSNLDNGATEWVFELLTNQDASELKGTTVEDLWDKIKSHKEQLITVCTKENLPSGYVKISVSSESTESYYMNIANNFVFCKHIYLIESVDVDKKNVKLRNPHGKADNPNNETYPTVPIQFIFDCVSNVTVF